MGWRAVTLFSTTWTKNAKRVLNDDDAKEAKHGVYCCEFEFEFQPSNWLRGIVMCGEAERNQFLKKDLLWRGARETSLVSVSILDVTNMRWRAAPNTSADALNGKYAHSIIRRHHHLWRWRHSCMASTAHNNRRLHTKAIKTNENVSGAFYSGVTFTKFLHTKSIYGDCHHTIARSKCTHWVGASSIAAVVAVAASRTCAFSSTAEEIANVLQKLEQLIHTVIRLCQSNFSFTRGHRFRKCARCGNGKWMPPCTLM